MTTPTTTAALASTDSDGYGTVAGVFSTFRATGLTLGIAIMGAILSSFGPNAAFDRGFTIRHHVAFVHGFSTAVIVNAGSARRRPARRRDDALPNPRAQALLT